PGPAGHAGRQAALPAVARSAEAAPGAGEVWPVVCEQFALRMLLLAEDLRPALDRLEADEDDPDRLERLYRVDHAVTRIRRTARELRILAGRDGEELAGYTSSLVDVIRVAESSIERYTQVVIGTVAELAVVAYAADDVASLLAALLDNATRYSPSRVTVSGHLLQDGGVMLRIEDAGIGIEPERLAAINERLAGPVPEIDESAGRHTGLPVAHRLARRHGIGVRLAGRSAGPGGASGGTTAMVTIPADLLCEIPSSEPAGALVPAADDGTSAAHLAMARPAPAPVTVLAEPPTRLPRREKASLRGDDTGPGRAAEAAETAAGPSAEEASAARRSFADDLSAFTTGQAEARRDAADDTEGQVP
ncbi:MAG TPA: ATP-binding protein, partial [Thermomonospora sp.]|nr:ATP-binding protein [Thermomonospora sp.]